MKPDWMIGIDEVGRGSLAGPVVVCALAIPKGLSLRGSQLRPSSMKGRLPRFVCNNAAMLSPLRDSKKLTRLQREKWAAWVRSHPKIDFVIARVYPRRIERMNIAQAANLAATRACVRLANRIARGARRIKVFLDGGLHLRAYPRFDSRQILYLSATTVIRGDEKFTAVKLASIVAKVARDRLMEKLHMRYPRYGFAVHKGYGTKAHIAAIKKFGPSKIHRTTFIKNFAP